MQPDLLQLIYSSKALAPWTEQALQALLEGARINNSALGVSGLLLYADGHFLQVLEGPPAVVESLIACIEEDTRHDHLRVLMRRAVSERDFADWHMAFRTLDAVSFASHPALRHFFDDDFSAQSFLPWSSPARYLLQAFRDMGAQSVSA